MNQTFEKRAFQTPVDASYVKSRWRSQGFSFDVFRDPPGQEWNNFVHETDEYVVVANGELSIKVGTSEAVCGPGDLVRIPRGTSHSLKTVSLTGSIWYYGYGIWDKQ